MRVLFLSILLVFTYLESASANDILAERSTLTKLCTELAVTEDAKGFWSVRLAEISSTYLSKTDRQYREIKKKADSTDSAMMQKWCARERIGYDLAVMATRFGEDLEIFGDELSKKELSALDNFEREMTTTFKGVQAAAKSGWVPDDYFSIYYQFSSNAVENLYLKKEMSVEGIADFILDYNKILLVSLEGQSDRFEKYRNDKAKLAELPLLNKKDLLTCQWAQLASAHSEYEDAKWGDFERAGKSLRAYLLAQTIVRFYEEVSGKKEGVAEPSIVQSILAGRTLPRNAEQQKAELMSSCGEAHARKPRMINVLKALYPPSNKASK